MIRRNFEVEQIALSMERSGAVGISVLTEPKHFMGSLSSLTKVHTAVRLPILMKDIVLSIEQLDAATALGANAVLLIQGIYDRGYGEREIVEMIKEAHSRGLEVLLEVHDENEFHRAVTSDADLIGINNRNLATLQVDLNTTKKILERAPMSGMLVVSESGIKTADDIRFLNGCGANAFLVGSAVMSADDVESKVRDLANATKSKEIKA
jgi:indole-3-glycerol phosphate synthase